MNRQTDIDQLLRSWLDEGELSPPDGPVWAALERVETTRQRGALRVSLEERLMRIQPLATVAAVAVMAIIGLAIYFSLAGGPNVGDRDASPTPNPGALTTEEFAQPMTLTPPEGWTLVEEPSSMVITRLEGDRVREQIAVFQIGEAAIWSGGADGHVAFPPDLVAWLEDFPEATEEVGPASIEITETGTSSTAVDGATAEVIDAATRFTADPALESTMNLIVAEAANIGTDALIVDGEGRMRFVVLDERGLLFTYHASDDEFAEERLDSLLASVTFADE